MSLSPPEDAHLWTDIATAILNKEQNPQRYRRVFIGGIESQCASVKKEHTPKLTYQNHQRDMKNYALGEPFVNTYFTKREAECMILILQGHTNTQIAQLLNLSARTIEFYIKNMRQKTGCVSKAHLTNCVAKTDFIDTLDFTMDDLCNNAASERLLYHL